MSRFSKYTIKKLKQAGWRPNRRVDISKTIELLDKNYCTYTKDMLDFLLEFQDLLLEFDNGEEAFDFTLHESWVNQKNCIFHNSLFEESVYSIGVMNNCDLIVLISELNKVYAMTEKGSELYLLGDTFDRGIEFICTYGLSDNIEIFNKRKIY